MNDKLMKILAKKRDLSDVESQARMSAAKDLSDMAGEEMGNKLDGLKKVSVMSDSPEGLSEGLDKAKEIADAGDEEESPEHEMSESPDEEASEHDPLNFEALSHGELMLLQQKILEAMKKKSPSVI